MSTDALRKLTIENLRGSVSPFTLAFEKGKKLTVVYGENATGKSTIRDAFEFLGKGHVGSLDNRGLGKTTRYWPSLGKKPADVSVMLEDKTTTCTGRIQKGEVLCTPVECRPHVEVLRRSQILSLLQATPANRYEAVRAFIDVSGVEASEGALNQLIRELTQNRQIALARVEENRAAIQQFWETANKPGTDPIVWAEEESKRDQNVYDAEIVALARLQTSYSRLTDYPGRLALAESALLSARSAASAAEQDFERCAAKIVKDAEAAMQLLEAARSYLLRNPDPAACPLCESSEKVANLSERITDRLEFFRSLKAAQKKKDDTAGTLQRAEQQVTILAESAAAHSTEFKEALTSFEWPSDVKLPSSSIPDEFANLKAWLNETVTSVTDWKTAENLRNDKKHFLDALKRALTTWKRNIQAQEDLQKELPKLERTLEIVKDERRQFTDKILANIAQEVGRIYEAVHPGEGLNKISLELDPQKRASLDINASFCGTTTPPQAYFSDSHLDTLGLCVFLALAALDKPEEAILVLDDVLASVDEPHVDRLIEALYAEAVKFRHCAITTHYRPWKQKLRWGWLKSGQCQFIELTKWTTKEGMTLIRSIPDVERLRILINETPPDLQLVCAKAGVILEAVLDFLTQLYECAVSRRANGLYTLGDLLPSINKKLRGSLQVDIQSKDAAGNSVYTTTSLTPLVEELTRIAQVRNVFGCHFNALSFELLDDEALGLVNRCSRWLRRWPILMRDGPAVTSPGSTGQTRVKLAACILLNNRRKDCVTQTKTRTDLDRKGEPAKAGAAHPARRPNQIVSCRASRQ